MSVIPDGHTQCAVRCGPGRRSFSVPRSFLRRCSVLLVALSCTTFSQEALPIVSSVRFEGNTAVSDASLRRLAEISDGSPLQQSIVERDIQAMLLQYAELGYPFTAIRIGITIDDTLSLPQAGVVFSVSEGPRVALREITVQGNTGT